MHIEFIVDGATDEDGEARTTDRDWTTPPRIGDQVRLTDMTDIAWAFRVRDVQWADHVTQDDRGERGRATPAGREYHPIRDRPFVAVMLTPEPAEADPAGAGLGGVPDHDPRCICSVCRMLRRSE